ncbi:MAG: C1 family peptidase [Bacteroidales bacterium]|nr:C1 family peptidase [Bacteroidales bacterium]MDD3910725.1 C1 family peptidase [Bacteroidales bacterium]MDD4420037.1 C1 family peptidase [Bacteroidales bacterium]
MKINIKHIIIIALSVTLTYSAANAQSIGSKEMRELEQSYAGSTTPATLQSVLQSSGDFESLAENSGKLKSYDNYFKYKADIGSINDQKKSGRCWMFACMNSLRTGVMKKYNLKDFDFSHTYNFFYDLLEKSNLFLEEIIATSNKPMDDREVSKYFNRPITDGGVWSIFYAETIKYGVVPMEVMPETGASENDEQLLQILKKRLRKGGWAIREIASKNSTVKKSNNKLSEEILNEMEAEKISVLKDVYKILALTIGVPPKEFTWRYTDNNGNTKTVSTTPKEFYASVAINGYGPENYIMITNDPGKEYYKLYEIKNYKSVIEGFNWTYLNLPYSEIEPAALASIKNNESIYLTIDSGAEADKKSGAGLLDTGVFDYNTLFGVNLDMDRKSMILTKQISSTHAILLMGCDTDKNDNPTKWLAEDSFGLNRGRNGFHVMSNKWFETYTFRMVINKKYLRAKAQAALGQKPELLPVWDYMMF